jgi:hypothetical protein
MTPRTTTPLQGRAFTYTSPRGETASVVRLWSPRVGAGRALVGSQWGTIRALTCRVPGPRSGWSGSRTKERYQRRGVPSSPPLGCAVESPRDGQGRMERALVHGSSLGRYGRSSFFAAAFEAVRPLAPTPLGNVRWYRVTLTRWRAIQEALRSGMCS